MEKELGGMTTRDASPVQSDDIVSLGPFELANLRISRKRTVKLASWDFSKGAQGKGLFGIVPFGEEGLDTGSRF